MILKEWYNFQSNPVRLINNEKIILSIWKWCGQYFPQTTLYLFTGTDKELMFSLNYISEQLLTENIIKNLNMCINEIIQKITEINEKNKYNQNLWVLSSWRKYDFTNDEIYLKNKDAKDNENYNNLIKSIYI